MENSLRDKELIKNLIDNTFDLVDLYSILPISIKKHLKLDSISYKIAQDKKEIVINHVGNVLYNTRNSIVHAKSNYRSTGLECNGDEIEDLNKFMHMACYSTIKWYNRLPDHLKMS